MRGVAHEGKGYTTTGYKHAAVGIDFPYTMGPGKHQAAQADVIEASPALASS